LLLDRSRAITKAADAPAFGEVERANLLTIHRPVGKVFGSYRSSGTVYADSQSKRVANGANFLTMLRSKYEKVRLDLLGAV
jgi:hypothetical protein